MEFHETRIIPYLLAGGQIDILHFFLQYHTRHFSSAVKLIEKENKGVKRKGIEEKEFSCHLAEYLI